MLYNPFEVRTARAGDEKEDVIQNTIDQVTDSLVSTKYKLIAQVEDGTATRAALKK